MYTFQFSKTTTKMHWLSYEFPMFCFFFPGGTWNESERNGGDGNGPMVSLSSCDESNTSAQRGLEGTIPAGTAMVTGQPSFHSYLSWALCALGWRVEKVVTPLEICELGCNLSVNNGIICQAQLVFPNFFNKKNLENERRKVHLKITWVEKENRF